jgi:ABC-type glycerol-3-phosphate transport system permease component
VIFALVLANLMPGVAKLVPLYLMYSAAGLYDTRVGLVLLFTLGVLPLGTWMMKGYFDRVPRELEESALVDGCSRLGAFARVTVPLAAPGLAALAVIAFVDAWNAFTFPLILTGQQALKPYTVAVYGFVGEYGEVQWHLVSAVAVASVIPLLVLFVVFQRALVSGLTGGAIKT